MRGDAVGALWDTTVIDASDDPIVRAVEQTQGGLVLMKGSFTNSVLPFPKCEQPNR